MRSEADARIEETALPSGVHRVMFKPSAPSTTTEPCNPLTVTDAEMPDASTELTVVENPFDGRDSP